jgi:hypothetical protein
MFMFDWSALMTLRGHPGQLAYTFVIVSYRRLSPPNKGGNKIGGVYLPSQLERTH